MNYNKRDNITNNIVFSVIVPHYNCVDLLKRAIVSIPNRNDIEIIVVDNGFNKIPVSLFNESCKNVTVIYSEVGMGAGRARNVGLKQAKGMWLLFLDADDYFSEYAFDCFFANANSKNDIIFFKMNSCFSDTFEPSNRGDMYCILIDAYVTHKPNSEENLRYNFSSPCAKMVKKSLIDEHNILFDEILFNNDDMFALKVGYYAKTVNAVDAVVYCATVRKGSISTTVSLKSIQDRFNLNLSRNKFLRIHHLNKYQWSVMAQIFAVRKFGVKYIFILIWKSIKSGNNILIGSSRWYDTYKRMKKLKSV